MNTSSPRTKKSTVQRPTQAGAVPKGHKTPTIKEFADAIGVSPTTVSRSITKRGRISDETRQMVLQRMEELGYTPNLHAQRLVTGRANTVAICIDGGIAPASDDLFMVGLIRGLQQALQSYDYGLLILGPGDLLKRWVDSRAVDGVIVLGGTQEQDDRALSIVRPEVPCIVIGTTPLEPRPHIGSVFIDLAGSGIQAARTLFESGHRQIGFIGSSYSQSVLPTFKRELEQLGATLRDEWTIITDNSSDCGERAMRELLALPNRPSAVFTRTDLLAMGAMRAARKMQVEVPDKISVLGHDDLAVAQFVEPPLSTIRIDCDALGKAVVALLFDLLDHPDTLLEARAVPTALVMRESVGPAPF